MAVLKTGCVYANFVAARFPDQKRTVADPEWVITPLFGEIMGGCTQPIMRDLQGHRRNYAVKLSQRQRRTNVEASAPV